VDAASETADVIFSALFDSALAEAEAADSLFDAVLSLCSEPV
jgi:hypothetical protein